MTHQHYLDAEAFARELAELRRRHDAAFGDVGGLGPDGQVAKFARAHELIAEIKERFECIAATVKGAKSAAAAAVEG